MEDGPNTIINLSYRPEYLSEGAEIISENERTVVGALGEERTTPLHLHRGENPTPATETPLDFERQISKELSAEDRESVLKILRKYGDCFRGPGGKIGRCNMTKVHIDTGDARPIYQTPGRSPWKEKEEINKQVEEMLRQDIIEPLRSAWSSRVVLAKKPDGSWRFCNDMRALNSVTKADVYPLPNVNEILSSLEGSRFFSNMDLQAGFHQLELTPDSKERTAFVTSSGLYQYKVLPFGCVTAPVNFQRTMDIILAGLGWLVCLCYLDDLIVHARTLNEHLEKLDLVLERIHGAGLTIKLGKCHFAEGQLKCLGHIVSAKGIGVDPDKVKAISDFPEPKENMKTAAKVKLIQSFVGLVNYYRSHVENFATMARPLTELTKKGAVFTWGPTEKKSFNDLNEAMLTAVTLAHPHYDAPMEIYPDACTYGIGAVLSQKIKGEERPIAYASRLLSKTERNYSISELECLALVWGLKKFRMYV